jgi:hypothetical protein
MPKQQKHHYIPSFYTKRWANERGQLLEYRLGYQGRIFHRPTHPDGTGYIHGLNTIERLPPELANFIEDQFLQRADDLACQAHDHLLAGTLNVNTDIQSGWARFIMSLMHRTPERIKYLKGLVEEKFGPLLEEMRAKYPGARGPNDPATFDEYVLKANPMGRSYAEFFQSMVDSENVGRFINQMRWGVITLHRPRVPLLTSDRPMVMSNGINRPDSHIIIPISPVKLFIAANNVDFIQQFQLRAETGEVLEVMNDLMARQARKYLYASEPVDEAFLQGRLGQKIPCYPAKEAT